MINCACFHPVAPLIRYSRTTKQPLCQKNFTINRKNECKAERLFEAIFLQVAGIAYTDSTFGFLTVPTLESFA
jgi:hypothetical protein